MSVRRQLVLYIFTKPTVKCSLTNNIYGIVWGVANDDTADNSAARIVFSADTNSLFFNSNGITDGFGTGAKFATIGAPVYLNPCFE